MEARAFEEHFLGRQAGMLESIRQFIDIESPSFDEAGSREAVSFLAAEAAKLNCISSIERINAEGFGEHLILRAFPGQPGKALLLGHTDTVHPRATHLKNPTRIEGERFFGCGIFDMKANIILILEVLAAFEKFKLLPGKAITILLSCDEEVGSHSGREIVEREAKEAGLCFVFEPSLNGKVKTGRKGTGMFTLNANGIPAHAGLEPEKGASAILEISRQVEKLHSLNAPELGTTVNVCTISGGTTSNVIPAEAECSVDIRFSKMGEAERLEKEIKALSPFDPRVSLEIKGEINRPPMERTEGVVALFEKARETAASFGYLLEEAQVGGASDGNFVGAMGVPVLDGLGIRGDGAHTLDEHIIISDIPKRATLLAKLIMQL